MDRAASAELMRNNELAIARTIHDMAERKYQTELNAINGIYDDEPMLTPQRPIVHKTFSPAASFEAMSPQPEPTYGEETNPFLVLADEVGMLTGTIERETKQALQAMRKEIIALRFKIIELENNAAKP